MRRAAWMLYFRLILVHKLLSIRYLRLLVGWLCGLGVLVVSEGLFGVKSGADLVQVVLPLGV
jgi:hypothetical protein